MKKCRLVALFLALIMLASIAPLTLAEDVPTITIMMNNNGRTWDPETSNNKKIMEILGVNLDVTLVDAETMTLSFSSGDLADIVTFSNLTFSEFVDTGYLLPLDDLVEKYGENIKKPLDDFAKGCVTVNGTMYALPYENNNVKYFTTLRADWLKTLGYDLSVYPQLPDSDVYEIPLADYEKMLEDMTKKDPDGNGKDDTYGLSTYGAANDATSFMSIYGAFGGVREQYYVKDEALWAYETTDEYRNALVELNKLWNMGVIDPELFILQKDQAKANIMAGKHGSYVSWWSTAYEMIRDGMYDLQPTTEWATAVIVGPDGYKGAKDNGRITTTICITTACENPELAMQVLDKLHSEECWWLVRYGIAGEHYEVDENGKYNGTRTAEGQKLFEGMTMDTLYTLINAIDLENEANSIPPTDPIMLIRYGMLVHQFLDAPLYHDAAYGLAQPQESMDFGVDVKNCVTSYNMKFITGELEINDANWADYLEAWKNAGGSDILAAYAEAYNDKNGTDVEPAM
ncbi:MAG: extracellular solute-binding protein [Clostridiales bacterium]|nr:extracellular solute-binding protein [Clostridiales bacterium]